MNEQEARDYILKVAEELEGSPAGAWGKLTKILIQIDDNAQRLQRQITVLQGQVTQLQSEVHALKRGKGEFSW